MDIDPTNRFLVSSVDEGVLVLNPPRSPMSREDALGFAAWLVAVAEHGAAFEFQQALETVLST